MAEVNLDSYLSDFVETCLMDKINTHICTTYSIKNTRLELDYEELEKYDLALADYLILYPESIIEKFEEHIKNLNIETPIGKYSPKIIIKNVPKLKHLNEVFNKEKGSLVKFSCMVISKSKIRPLPTLISYVCNICESEIKQKRTYFSKGYKKLCDSCRKFSLVPSEKDSEHEHTNIVFVQVQETLESSKSLNPERLTLLVTGELTDDILPKVDHGDNITVTGIIHVEDSREKFFKEKGIKDYFLMVNNIESIKKDFEDIYISPAEEKQIIELSKSEKLDQILLNSIAKDVYGYDEIKKALLLQLFGGTKNKLKKSGVEERSQIHVLLIGDPGLAKSEFLRSVNAIAPKSIYADGGNSTAVGLTASVSEKNEFGERVCRAGALVLASGGMVQLDEFDKLSNENKEHLNQALEHGKVSINKANFSISVSAKTSVLAAANPKNSNFIPTNSLISQFNIVATTLSRFDLIFAIVDKIDEVRDRLTAKHMLKIHSGNYSDNFSLEPEFVKKYIAYARKNIQPVLTEKVRTKIEDYYTFVRLDSKIREVNPITPRVINNIVRLSEANAKMRLSNVVEEIDVEVARSLFTYCLNSIAKDDTGLIDPGVLHLGETKKQINERNERETFTMIRDVILNLTRERDLAELDLILKETASLGVTENRTKEILHILMKNGDIYEKNKDEYSLIKT